MLLTNDTNNFIFPDAILIFDIYTTFSKVKFLKSSHSLSPASLSCYRLQNSHQQLTHGEGTLRFWGRSFRTFPLLNNHQGHFLCTENLNTRSYFFQLNYNCWLSLWRKGLWCHEQQCTVQMKALKRDSPFHRRLTGNPGWASQASSQKQAHLLQQALLVYVT